MKYLPQILKPMFGNLKDQNLKLKDILTYMAIRSFQNSEDKYCNPKYSEIASLSGMSVKMIKPSLQRLSDAGFVEITEVKSSWCKRVYCFKNDGNYQSVSSSYLLSKSLTIQEKAFIFLLAEYAHDNVSCSLKDVSEGAGINYTTCVKLFKSLKDQNLVTEAFDYDANANDLLGWIILKSNDGIDNDLEPMSIMDSNNVEYSCNSEVSLSA